MGIQFFLSPCIQMHSMDSWILLFYLPACTTYKTAHTRTFTHALHRRFVEHTSRASIPHYTHFPTTQSTLRLWTCDYWTCLDCLAPSISATPPSSVGACVHALHLLP